jgi:magnesium transporter
LETGAFPDAARESEALFVVCLTYEVAALQRVFGWDDGTVLDCADLDESVRYTSYDGYDFVSLVHMETTDDGFMLREINLYVSGRYVVLVMPEHDSPRLKKMEEGICAAAASAVAAATSPSPAGPAAMDAPPAAAAAGGKGAEIGRLYFLLFHGLLADFADMLEALEDSMEALSESITESAGQDQLHGISRLRKTAYTAKKQLRALSYIGAQILIDENGLMDKKLGRHFRSIDTRLKKLYDFSESLYVLANELLHTYDSKLTIKMNDMVNRLTMLMLLIGPLTVVAGIYGMNFKFMPELSWPFGYPFALCLMAAVSFAMYRILKRKKWL